LFDLKCTTHITQIPGATDPVQSTHPTAGIILVLRCTQRQFSCTHYRNFIRQTIWVSQNDNLLFWASCSSLTTH